jgi:hypothetical protein
LTLSERSSRRYDLNEEMAAFQFTSRYLYNQGERIPGKYSEGILRQEVQKKVKSSLLVEFYFL